MTIANGCPEGRVNKYKYKSYYKVHHITNNNLRKL